MSIQFRSRVKSIADFGNDLRDVGTCCYSNGNKLSLSYYECFISNGSFFPGDVQCPSQGQIGSCYACAYLSESEKSAVVLNPSLLQNNTSLGVRTTSVCECNRIGGAFNTHVDPANPSRDIRLPKSCCHFDYNVNGFPIGITCENVCSSKECSLKGITFASVGACCKSDNTCTYGPKVSCNTSGGEIFYPGTPCTENICTSPPVNLPRHFPIYDGNTTCLQSTCTTAQNSFRNDIIENISIGQIDAMFDVGPCYELYELENGYTYSCDIKHLHDCTGYWLSTNYEGNNNFLFCDHKYKPSLPVKISGRKVEPEMMKESEFDELNLIVGDEYKGGYYIGKFEVNRSSVFGTMNFNEPNVAHFYDDTPRDKYDKWALIIDYEDFDFSMMNNDEMKRTYEISSNSDGYYNLYGDGKNFYGYNLVTYNTIKNTIRNGFADFYIPSLIELNFLANQIKNDPLLIDSFGLPGVLVSSSIFFENLLTEKTFQQTFNDSKFLYAQYFNSGESNLGKVILRSARQKGSVRLFRKVILT